MSDLTDIFRHLFGRSERNSLRATDEALASVDHRLEDVEVEQKEIEARLRRLEVQSWRD